MLYLVRVPLVPVSSSVDGYKKRFNVKSSHILILYFDVYVPVDIQHTQCLPILVARDISYFEYIHTSKLLSQNYDRYTILGIHCNAVRT